MKLPYALALLPLLTHREYHPRSSLLTSPDAHPLPASYGPDGNTFLNQHLPVDIFQHLSTYSPRYTVLSKGLSDALPPGCSVTLVNSLERHGIRYMTSGALTTAQTTLTKIQTGLKNIPLSQLPVEMRFLKTAVISNATADLAPLGALQAYYSGKYTRQHYSQLASTAQAFIRTSGDEDADRVLVTSQFWSMGYNGQEFPQTLLSDGASVKAAGATAAVQPDVVISEMKGKNNTLDVATCPADDAYGDAAGEDLAHSIYGNSTLYPVIGARLEKAFSKAGATSLKLTYTDVANVFNICAFASAAGASVSAGTSNVSISPFCGLFSSDDFLLYEYYIDVGKYYGSGYGDPYHRALAQGYLRELLSRLTSTPVDLSAPTADLNTTLDAIGATSTFPIPTKDSTPNGPRIFHDGSHDNNISPIAAAFGLFRDDHPLPLTKHAQRLTATRKWRFATIAPLQGKLVWEKISCPASPLSPLSKLQKEEEDVKQEYYIRIRANEAIQPPTISWCQSDKSTTTTTTSMPSQSKSHPPTHPYTAFGLCPLVNVVRSLDWVTNSNEWDKCYETGPNPPGSSVR